MQSVYSFLYPSSYLPTTVESLKRSCISQTEGFKCVKDRSRTAPAILKRGLASLIQNRQRYHKKICTNLESEPSRKALQAFKCIMDKKFPLYQELDAKLANSLSEIRRRNYSDAAAELKYICCTMLNYRKVISFNTFKSSHRYHESL